MPAKKGSLDKSIGRKALDGAKYVGKNFWKVLPVGSLINYTVRLNKKLTKETPLGSAFHTLYGAGAIATLALYAFLGVETGAWTPAQIKQYNEKERIKAQMEAEHKSEVDYFYNRMFENAKSKEDSVGIYQKYGLPIKLLNPSFEQKEKAIKQNELEKGVETPVRQLEKSVK